MCLVLIFDTAFPTRREAVPSAGGPRRQGPWHRGGPRRLGGPGRWSGPRQRTVAAPSAAPKSVVRCVVAAAGTFGAALGAADWPEPSWRRRRRKRMAVAGHALAGRAPGGWCWERRPRRRRIACGPCTDARALAAGRADGAPAAKSRSVPGAAVPVPVPVPIPRRAVGALPSTKSIAFASAFCRFALARLEPGLALLRPWSAPLSALLSPLAALFPALALHTPWRRRVLGRWRLALVLLEPPALRHDEPDLDVVGIAKAVRLAHGLYNALIDLGLNRLLVDVIVLQTQINPELAPTMILGVLGGKGGVVLDRVADLLEALAHDGAVAQVQLIGRMFFGDFRQPTRKQRRGLVVQRGDAEASETLHMHALAGECRKEVREHVDGNFVLRHVKILEHN
mmetsp:Transcript_13115/g.35115  ORF Transcript_13115/g.35115 Transcript_13115/m.35115 type:complete len:396 (-) Transcript_13115:268-1455(-)